MAFIELNTPDQLEYKFYPARNGQFNFKVRTANDAHVALTSGPGESDPMIEIFIGGWNNAKSVIRKNRTKPEKSEANTPNILNAGEFRGFWIRWNNGVYTVGSEGDNSPFLSYQDDQVIPISFAGVCTGWGATGSWLIEGSKDEIKTADCLQYTFVPISSGSVTIEFKGPSNCHIALLSTNKEVKPITEIILGGWDNQASVIRLDLAKETDHRVETKNIVSKDRFTTFYVKWQGGYLSIRAGSATGPIIIDRKDCIKFNVSHIGVRTAWGATGSWRLKFGDTTTSIIASQSPQSAPQFGGWSAPQSGGGGGGGYATWVPSANGQVPPGAQPHGEDANGEPIFVARARHNGALIPGKLVQSHGVAYVPWGGVENAYAEYEILVGGGQWVPVQGANIPPNALPGGESEEGEPLFVGRARHEGSLTVGKVQPSHGVVYIPFGGAEIPYDSYEVLVN